MPKEFIDKYAQVGRVKLTNRSVKIKTEPLSGGSRLLNLLKDEHIRFETLDNDSALKIDLSKIHSSKIRIQKDNALALAKWIISNYE